MTAELVDPMLPEWYRIHRVHRETHDTFTIQLQARDQKTDFGFMPGQFNMVYVYGVGEVPISISGDPAKTDRVTHTIRAVGTVTKAMWRLKGGDTIGLRGPYGTPWPLEEARGRDIVIVTGGIGLAPLRPVLYHVLANRGEYGRFELLYGARTPDDLLYQREFLNSARPDGLDVSVTVDRVTRQWSGRIGVVTGLIPGARFNPENAIAMVCGPEVMMRFSIKALTDRGLSMDRIYVSMERNMKCGVGFCGHCQYGPTFVCKDGPVFQFDEVEDLFNVRERGRCAATENPNWPSGSSHPATDVSSACWTVRTSCSTWPARSKSPISRRRPAA